ncbi:glycogen debranching protein GlgX [Aquihabitans daechungensis]|uniref:glycogen debranching protein GlgX n=1 Tax=Aquihabitans daechungensis TaxID=1052257 RepID=UPI003B9FC830
MSTTLPDVPTREILPGQPFPLGATWTHESTNFSLFSQHAEAVELCLFDEAGREERIPVEATTAFHWHVELPGIAPGQRYGYRVHGPWDPSTGHRFNPAKLLLDPYARAVDGVHDASSTACLPYTPGGEDADLQRDDTDDAAEVPKGVVIDPAFDWEDDAPPAVPFAESVIYETHVKGFTMRHPDVREDLRGTYGGLASDAAIAHLTDLGVTAVELLPIQQIAPEGFLAERGLTNYWGYSTIGYFAPHSGYSATGTDGEQVREFKGMVKALHRAGIEVILDVVYNHTAEGNHLGPMLSFKGIDNVSYYRQVEDDPRYYLDFTGTGNTLDVQHPSTLRLITDSLRYWVEECHVDGFRFDLASTLARGLYDVGRLSSFFDVIHQDPVLSTVKLIAEPWDVGPGGYQVGNFPVLWAEWNGVYRDDVRDAWRGEASMATLATRLSGSTDLYDGDGRTPTSSINFITAHDGFTLADLVSYDHKHNDANGEDNNDGADDNRSWNSGAEGPTDDAEINGRRERRHLGLLATLLLSQGVPMVLAGDEMGRSQGGNNNSWCHDDEISWIDWEQAGSGERLLTMTRRLIALRRAEPVFRRRSPLRGEPLEDGRLPDAWWFRPDGSRMTKADWDDGGRRVVGLFLNGDAIADLAPDGERVRGGSFLVLHNTGPDDAAFVLPSRRFGRRWTRELDTSQADAGPGEWSGRSGDEVPVPGYSVVVLRRI